MMSQLEVNKAVVRKFLENVPSRNLEAIAECLAEDAVQYYVKPSTPNDDGTSNATENRGRDGILNEIRTYLYQLYRPGTIEIEIQRMVAEGDYVAVQFILRAVTGRRGEPYENYYHFLYRCRDGKVAEYWEYVDTAYGNEKLFS